MNQPKRPSPQVYEGTMPPAKLLALFVPEYAEKRVAILDLDQEARDAMSLSSYKSVDPRAFSEAGFCSKFVEELHRRKGIDASFGGYLEDRGFLWQGTYLGGTDRSLHLGVDFNVPAGAAVVTPFEGVVVRSDDDTPERCGWGPRLFIECREPDQSGVPARFVYIFAHLASICVGEGDLVRAGTRIAAIGAPPINGNWYPHLHVQKVRGSVFDHFRATELRKLDGYGLKSEVETLIADFPDPLSALV